MRLLLSLYLALRGMPLRLPALMGAAMRTPWSGLALSVPALRISDGSWSSGLGSWLAGYEISTETSLFVVATLLGGGVFLSLRFPKEDKSDSL